MRKNLLCGLILVLALMAGCSNSKKNNAEDTVKPQPFQKVNFTNPVNEIITFTVSTDSNLYILGANGLLSAYKNDGTLIREYENTGDLIAVCWHNGMIYAYDAVKQRIITLNTENGEIKNISDELKAEEILKLTFAGEYLYALAVPEVHGDYVPGPNRYINFGEIIYQINPKTGEVKNIHEDNIIAIYTASDGKLYYYAYRDDTYALYHYNTKDGQSSKLYDMNDTGYITAFVYEKDYFVYSNQETVVALNLSDNTEKIVDEQVLILCGNDMTCLYGNVIYFGYRLDYKPNTIISIYLENIGSSIHIDINAGELDNNVNQDKSQNVVKENRGRVTISTYFGPSINSTAVKRISGINTRIINQGLNDEVVLTEVMAGNSDVDIYITAPGSYLAEGVLSKGIFVPLNDSIIIKEYKDKCFDYVADAMMSLSGDIWALPLCLEANVIWYVPENIEKFEIDLEEFRYFDDFLKLSERMPKEGFPAAYVDSPFSFANAMHAQYEMINNNFKEKKVNYNTPLYKDIFEKTRSGWVNNTPNPKHPIFRNSDDYQGELISESAPYDKSRVIYKFCSIGEHLNVRSDSLEGWRVLPVPRISPDVMKNVVGLEFAFINPHSKNKELALEYLETLTKVSFEYIHYTSAFLFKDKEMYADRYDISQPAFEDIYNVVKDGKIVGTGGFYLNSDIINNYQNGRLSLDEAVAAIQREAEMWLNE